MLADGGPGPLSLEARINAEAERRAKLPPAPPRPEAPAPGEAPRATLADVVAQIEAARRAQEEAAARAPKKPCADCEAPVPALAGVGEVCPDCHVKREHVAQFSGALASIPERYRWASFRGAAELMAARVRPCRGVREGKLGKELHLAECGPPLVKAERLLLMGPAGCGKTTIAAALLRELVDLASDPDVPQRVADRARLARFLHAYDLTSDDRASLEAARDASVLVIDDLGRDPDAFKTKVPEVIHRRHAKGRPTWITTGLRPDELLARYASLERRLFEGAVVYTFFPNSLPLSPPRPGRRTGDATRAIGDIMKTDSTLVLAHENEAPEPAAELDAYGRPLTREQRRSRRKREVRAKTISVKRMTKRELEIGRLMYPDQPGEHYERPKTRAECANGPRPCPYVSCAHHLYLDVSPRTGAIKLNYPDLEPDQMTTSCALDVADRGGVTLEETGAIMNLTRERIRQLEVKALAKLTALQEMESLRDFVDEGPVGKRRLPLLRVVGEGEAPSEEDGEGDDDDEARGADWSEARAPIDLVDEFDAADGFIGLSPGVTTTRLATERVARLAAAPRLDEAKRLAGRLVSFGSAEFARMFGAQTSAYLRRLVAEGYVERLEKGRYAATAKLEGEVRP